MINRATRLAVLIALLLLLAVPGVASALPLDSTVPQLPASPVPITLAAGSAGVYRVALTAGETLVLRLSPAPAVPDRLDLDLYLYGPTAVETNHSAPLAASKAPPTGYPEAIDYRAPVTGTYYVEVFAAEESGAGQLSWSIVPEPLLPVYRFYNNGTGTHFYTPSATERDIVIARWSSVFTYEGIAYNTKASKNTQPLYRFYNQRNGGHFYTASSLERDAVIARWSYVYTYEGETYRVTTWPEPGKAPVYRFYNVRNGSHFFTASLTERDTVIARYPGIYQYEGPAFYLGQ